MSQHHFTNLARGFAPVDVVVGFKPRNRAFFIEIFGAGQTVPAEKHNGLAMVSDVERALSRKGIALQDKIANALEDELAVFDYIGAEKIEKRVRFYPAHH
jgi:hypothetical protein